MFNEKCEIREIGKKNREGGSGARRVEIKDARNTWIIELCEDGVVDLSFKLDGFSNYVFYLTNFVESNINGKTSTRTSGEFKYNLLSDSGSWETKRINNLLRYVKSITCKTGWKKCI